MPAPPPPPMKGPPPPAVRKAPPKTKGRGDLLKSIEGFKAGKLKKAETVDKSGPAISAKVSTSISAGSGGGGGGGSGASSGGAMAAPPMMVGGLFAGGMPKLRKTGRAGASTLIATDDLPSSSAAAPAAAAVPKAQPPLPKKTQAAVPKPQPAVPKAQPQVAKRVAPAASPIAKAQSFSASPSSQQRESGMRAGASSAPALQSEGSGSFAVARFAFKAQRSGDLDLAPGDVVRVLDRCPAGSGGGKWWEGEQQGRRGHFPANYVAELTQELENVRIRYAYGASRPDELSLQPGMEVTVLLKRANGWWFGVCGKLSGFFPSNYREGGKPNAALSASKPKSAATVVPKAAPTAAAAAAAAAAPAPPVARSEGETAQVRARAMFDFVPQNSGDLALKKGEIVVVLQQRGNWWKGEVAGRTGVFPFNFVELI